MPDDPAARGANRNSPLLLGTASGIRAGGNRTGLNPYAQVALTYIRRPFSSWLAGLASVFFICVFIAFSLGGRVGLKDSWAVQLMLFFSLSVFLAVHMKGQFVDPRAHLAPGFRRVHATIAALATLIVVTVLPIGLAWFMGWHSMGFVALATLLFGTILWVVVNDATWTSFAILFGWSAFCSTQSGPAYIRELLSGQIELHAAAILVLGIMICLLAGIRLVRLNEEALSYESTLRWDWDWSEKTRQGWNDKGRFLPGLRDWIRDREMARLTRMARRASESWWSRICRWQTGMVAGWTLVLWIVGALIHVQAVSWWIAARTPRSAAATMGLTCLILTSLPAVITAVGVFQWRTFRLRRESLLPIHRRAYIRELGTAAALSHFQLWAGMSVALALWWLLVGPRPLPLALLAGVLVFSGAFQVAVFGVAVWAARYRTFVGAGMLFVLLVAAQPVQLRWVRYWGVGSPGQLPHELLWVAGIIAGLGLLATCDAYRRWLVADFD